MRAPRRGLLAVLPLVLGLAAPALAQDASFRLNNRTGVTVNEIYVSSSNDNSWGRDLLGANVLAPGNSLMVRPGQCINDIRVVFANGQAHERRRVDTCQITDYNLQ
jgi:hypothetical protein